MQFISVFLDIAKFAEFRSNNSSGNNCVKFQVVIGFTEATFFASPSVNIPKKAHPK